MVDTTDLAAPLSRLWRSVYRKAAEVAEARTTERLKAHVYVYHPDGVGPWVDEAGDTMTGDLSIEGAGLYADSVLSRTSVAAVNGTGVGSVTAQGQTGANLNLHSVATTGHTSVGLQDGAGSRWLMGTNPGASQDWLLERWLPAGLQDTPIVVRRATGAVEITSLAVGGAPAATLTTSTSAPAGAPNSLWFNPSESA